MYSDDILKQYLSYLAPLLFLFRSDSMKKKLQEILLEIEEIKEYMEGKHE